MSNSAQSAFRKSIGVAVGLALVACTGGCAIVGDVFSDGWAQTATITTPSAEVARAASAEPTMSQRDYSEIQVRAQDGTVSHSPLFFEDPFETADDDSRFAWSGADYLGWVCGPARFLANTALFPISAIDTAPWRIMESDGEPARRWPTRNQFDAVKGSR